MPKQHFVKIVFCLKKSLGKLVKQAPVFFSFSPILSLPKHPLRMTTQRMSG